MLRSTKAAPPSSCEFGALENEWALSPLRVRALDRVRLHAELTILAKRMRARTGSIAALTD
jgi:hypothetical protein